MMTSWVGDFVFDYCSCSIYVHNTGGSLFRIQVHEFVHNMVTQVLVDDPVHQLEAGESDWKYYT